MCRSCSLIKNALFKLRKKLAGDRFCLRGLESVIPSVLIEKIVNSSRKIVSVDSLLVLGIAREFTSPILNIVREFIRASAVPLADISNL